MATVNLSNLEDQMSLLSLSTVDTATPSNLQNELVTPSNLQNDLATPSNLQNDLATPDPSTVEYDTATPSNLQNDSSPDHLETLSQSSDHLDTGMTVSSSRMLRDGVDTKHVLLKLLHHLVSEESIVIPTSDSPRTIRISEHICNILDRFLNRFGSNMYDIRGHHNDIRMVMEKVLLEAIRKGVTHSIIVVYLAFVGRLARKSLTQDSFVEIWLHLNELFELYLMDWIDQTGGWESFYLRK